MKKTVCELFAGVGGFRCGLNHIKILDDLTKQEKWDTVWFNQWEPIEKRTQYAHDCYVYHFGTKYDKNGNDTTNIDINAVNKSVIPDFNLLVGGFPCQDYSVATSLSASKGLEGKKGSLWWAIRDTIDEKHPPFILLENVDRLLKSPAKQKGRDFGTILASLRDQGYNVEWRVINAADYGYQQRRRRCFIWAYHHTTRYSQSIKTKSNHTHGTSIEKCKNDMHQLLLSEGFFAQTFPVQNVDIKKMSVKELTENIQEISQSFSFAFENTGVMKDGVIYTLKTTANYHGPQTTLGDIMDTEEVDEKYFIPENRLFYTDPKITRSDETNGKLPKEDRQTWQYIKGGKKIPRKTSGGHEYIFSEGAIDMLDSYSKPARTLLTSEGSFSRTTHIVKDKKTGKVRLLTPSETERIQGFPTGHTKYCLTDHQKVEMPLNKRRFMMGNALVVNLIEDMEKTLSKIFEEED